MHIAAIVVRVLMLEQCGVLSHSIWNVEDDTKYKSNEDGYKYKPKKDVIGYDSAERNLDYKLSKDVFEYDSKNYDYGNNWTQDDFKYDSEEIDFNYKWKKNFFDYESKEDYDDSKNILDYDSNESDFNYNWTLDDFKYNSKEADFDFRSKEHHFDETKEIFGDYDSKEFDFKSNWTVDDFKSESEEEGIKYKANGEIDTEREMTLMTSPNTNDMVQYDSYDFISDPPEWKIPTEAAVNRLSRARNMNNPVTEMVRMYLTTIAPNNKKASGATNLSEATIPAGARFAELQLISGLLASLYIDIFLFLLGVLLSPIGYVIGSIVVFAIVFFVNFIISILFPPYALLFIGILWAWAFLTFHFFLGYFYALMFSAIAFVILVTTFPVTALAWYVFLRQELREELRILIRVLQSIEDFLISIDQTVREYIHWKFQYLPFIMNIKYDMYRKIHDFIFKTLEPFIRRMIAKIRRLLLKIHLKIYNEIWLSYRCHFKRITIFAYMIYQIFVKVPIYIDKALMKAAAQLKKQVPRLESATASAANTTLVALEQINKNLTRGFEKLGKWLDDFSDRNLNSTEILLLRFKSFRRSALDWFKYLLLGDGGPGGWIASLVKAVWKRFEQKCSLEYIVD